MWVFDPWPVGQRIALSFAQGRHSGPEVLRFEALLADDVEENENRKFVVAIYLGDDSVGVSRLRSVFFTRGRGWGCGGWVCVWQGNFDPVFINPVFSMGGWGCSPPKVV